MVPDTASNEVAVRQIGSVVALEDGSRRIEDVDVGPGELDVDRIGRGTGALTSAAGTMPVVGLAAYCSRKNEGPTFLTRKILPSGAQSRATKVPAPGWVSALPRAVGLQRQSR